MNVISLLVIIFIFISIIIFKNNSFYFISGLFLNIVLFIGYLIAISLHISVYLVTFVSFLLMTIVILYWINGRNAKTKLAFICVIFFLVTFTIVSLPLITALKTQGFSSEELIELANFDLNVDIPFSELNVSIILISFSGAVIDGSMAICSSTYEIYTKNPDLTFKELFNSSFNVVIEVLNSTIYTLLFAFIASNFALVIYLQDLNYSFLELINSKIFVGELLVSILTGCAGILILPLSCLLGSWILKKRFHTLY